MAKLRKDIVVAVVAVSAAAFSIYYSLAGRSEKINLDTYTVLGVVAAEESIRLSGNKGEVLIMIPDTGPNKNPSVEAEVKAFEQTIRKQKGMTTVIEKVQVTAMTMMATGGGVPPEAFFKGLEKHKGASVLALFFGFPDLRDAELEMFKKYNMKAIVVSSYKSAYQRLLEQGGIQLVITPRQDTPPENPPPARTVRDRFNQDFSIIGPQPQR